MENSKSTLGFIGIALGSVALIMALIHFYAGPFSVQPSLEQTVVEKAVAIKEATISALKGEEIKKEPASRKLDIDQMLAIGVSLFGGIAIILGVVGYATKEPFRVAGGAVFLGAGALAFQFLIIALGIIVIAILVAAVLPEIGID